MSTQSVAPIFLSASSAKIFPHQQSPIKWPLSLIKKREMQAFANEFKKKIYIYRYKQTRFFSMRKMVTFTQWASLLGLNL